MAALARGIDDGDGFQTLAGRYRLTTLRVVLRFAADEGYVQASPVDSLSRRQVPEPDEREVRVLDGKELARLLEHTPERSWLMLTVKVFSGLRSSELRGLIWNDIDLESAKLTVQRQMDSEDRGERVALKTAAARRTLPLRPQRTAGPPSQRAMARASIPTTSARGWSRLYGSARTSCLPSATSP